MAQRTYPADPADAALRLFVSWFGGYYARSSAIESVAVLADGVLHGTVTVGRKWSLGFSVVNTLAPDAELAFEAERAAMEQRLDSTGHNVAVWAPRGAHLPAGEPALSEFVLALDEARPQEDGRKELRRPVRLYLRRNGTTGSVITVLGGLSGHWAQFTNRVPGTYFLNALELYRMPMDQAERDELTERIVLAAAQPEADDSQVIPAEDAWTVNELSDGGSCILGTPKPDDDDHAATLRRNLRKLLKDATPALREPADAKALVVLGAATYAEEEKLSWALRGMDPALYAGYDLITIVADGVVKPLLKPGRSALPWDAPLPV
ncbi:MAG: hypothetical protein HYX53_07565 [Chloroflexi bacterium]|nr:hypothetical protein [Chloroflexota bacterium]